MRDIKFRAWDKAYKRMFVPLSVSDVLTEPKVFTVMQYTGLQDKNDREVYEGDILKDTHVGPALGGNTFRVDTVVFNTDPAGFTFGNRWSPLNTVDMRHMEVIGNVYENPELLKETPNA